MQSLRIFERSNPDAPLRKFPLRRQAITGQILEVPYIKGFREFFFAVCLYQISYSFVVQLCHKEWLTNMLHVRVKEDRHHEPDDLAGREMLSGRFVGHLRETADQVLENISHLIVAHGFRRKVNIACKFLHDQIQEVCPVQAVNLFRIPLQNDQTHLEELSAMKPHDVHCHDQNDTGGKGA